MSITACFRTTGYRQIIEVHLLFPHGMELGKAHRRATIVEEWIAQAIDVPAGVTTHLEPREDHQAVHAKQHYTGRPE